MTDKEREDLGYFLLEHLIEEASEIIQRATKIKRFGWFEIEPEQDKDNFTRLKEEVIDLFAIIEMLEDNDTCCLFDLSEETLQAIREKKKKVNRYIEYSKKLGRV